MEFKWQPPFRGRRSIGGWKEVNPDGTLTSQGKTSEDVFFLVAVDTEVFPIRSIQRVIQVISVLMVDSEEAPVLLVKFPSAPAADETVDLEGPLPVIAMGRFGLTHFLEEFVHRLNATDFLHFWISSVITAFYWHGYFLPAIRDPLVLPASRPAGLNQR